MENLEGSDRPTHVTGVLEGAVRATIIEVDGPTVAAAALSHTPMVRGETK